MAVGLNQEEQAKVQAFLKERGPGFKCPCCGGSHWAVDAMTAVRCMENGVLSADAVVRLVLVSCQRCGNVQQFAAKAMGL